MRRRTASRRCSALLALVVAAGMTSPVSGADMRLVDAARSGDEAAVRRLLDERVPVDTPAPDGATALHWAVRGDRVSLVRTLIAAGANVNAINRYGVSPLTLAAINGNGAVVSLLLAAGANANAASSDGETALMLASRTGRADAVRALIDGGADVNARERWQGETALMWAAGHDQGDVVRLLAARGADLDARSLVPELPKVKVDAATMVVTALPRGGLTALMLAARQGASGGARALVEAGADLNATDPDGTSALVIAIINAHYDVAALLIDAGASPAVADIAGMTPLYAAVDMQHQEPLINRPLPKPSGRLRATDIVRRLLDRGADPNAVLKTPLLMRQHNGGDGQLGEGATPLMRAAKVSDVGLMRLLLERGADPTRRLRNGTAALSIAVARSARNGGPEQATMEAVSLLVENGADINAANDNGETALHVAVARSDAVVRRLVDLGASLTAVDKFNRTPLDVALGVPGGGGRGRGGAPPAKAPVRESTAALLRELMKARGL